MEISVHFSNIQAQISEELQRAKYSIYIAVAWFSDYKFWKIINKKAEEGILIQLILRQDEFNKNYENYYLSLMRLGGQLYWNDHHHKFCVVDVKTVITGSYNWTLAANERGNRENIIIIKQNSEIAEQFSDEFLFLLKTSERYKLPIEKEIVYVNKEIIKEVLIEKIVEVPVEKIFKKPFRIIKKNDRGFPKIDNEGYEIYSRGKKTFCGKCHNNKLTVNPKAPKNIQSLVKYYCRHCNIYYDFEGLSL
ncbi:MAG: DUF1669 domain-containing protein [Bacteroidetes bacterium]|nr:DUF1669 domain-containing protein [Bacteroidota bacterium]